MTKNKILFRFEEFWNI